MDRASVNPISDGLECLLALARIQAMLTRRADSRLGTLHGLSFADFTVLLHLGRAPGQRLRRVDLAAEVGVTASAVTRTLIPLEKIGLVTRQPDPRDARVGYATLTRTGLRVLTEALESAETLSEDLLRLGDRTLLPALKRFAAELRAQ
jgi:DNA-binding MarR family transcriptional regulator